MPSTNAVPRAPCTPPTRYLLFRTCVIWRIALFTVGSVNFVLPPNSERYFAGPAVRAYTFSNQSVSVQESFAPCAHGFWPFAFSFFVTAMSWPHVWGTDSLYFLNWSGRYHITLFEFALAATP